LPLNVDVSNYKNMLNQFVVLDPVDCEKVWESNRTPLNEGRNRLLITEPVQEFISMIERRFVEESEFWDCRLLTGLSGCGKSVAFALAAAFLKNRRGFEVYWFRNGEDFDSNVASYFRGRTFSSLAVIFIDQIDKLPGGDYHATLRIGSQRLNRIVIGCGSGNLSFTHSSSETKVIGPPIEFNSALPFGSFKTLFHVPAEPSNQSLADLASVSKMLEFRPKSMVDVYEGTNGHFLSMTVIQHEISMHNCNVLEAWERAKQYFMESMLNFLKAQEVPSFAVLLHQHLFLNDPETPELDQKFIAVMDHRYVWNQQIHSALFAQSYHETLLLNPLTSLQLNRLQDVRLTGYDNNVMLGFTVERYVILNDEGIHKAAWSCIEKAQLFKNTSFPQNHLHRAFRSAKRYFYDEEMEVDPGIVLSDESALRIILFIPVRWNENWIDLIQLYLYKDLAIVVGNQITLQTAQPHVDSVNWLLQDGGAFLESLENRGFKVHRILLFTCSQAIKPQISVESNDFHKLNKELIFDYPLELALPKEVRQCVLSQAKIGKVCESARILRVVPKQQKRTRRATQKLPPAKKPRIR
jgi:hypothetical protein